jgi:hypothetical protein
MKKININSNFDEDDIHILNNIGSMAYFSGNIDVFDYYIEQILNLHKSIYDNEKKSIFYNVFRDYCIISVSSYNLIFYRILINSIKKEIMKMKNPVEIRNYLKILKSLSEHALKNNFDEGILYFTDIYKSINQYFVKNNMNISKIHLKMILLNLFISSEILNKESIKNYIITETNNLLVT